MNRVIIFITGMSGAGKSTLLGKLSRLGYKTIDTDYDAYSVNVYNQEQDAYEWIWDEEKMSALIGAHYEGVMFISGTVSNQRTFYPFFDDIIYLSAPLDVLLKRVCKRSGNDYGKTASERNEIIDNFKQFDHVIKAGATRIIDATKDSDDIAQELAAMAQNLLSP